MSFVFGMAALVMFVAAFGSLFKGRVGMAVVPVLMGLVMSGVAGAVALA